MQRFLNSTVPFSHMAQRDIKALNCPGSSPASRTESKGGELDKIHHLSNYLKNVMYQGTADYEWTHRTEKQTIIAQAECESQDSQEFCPNGSISSQSLLGTISRSRPRKKRHKKHRRKRGEKDSRASESVEVTGVPEQDSGEFHSSSLIQVIDPVCISSSISSTTYSSSGLSTERVSVQETEGPSNPYQWESQQTSLLSLSSCQNYGQESEELNSSLRSETECPLAATALRNFVTTEDPCFAYCFVKDVLREERERDEDEREESDKNEGILFKEGLQPVNYEYREGREYERCRFLKQGSFGEVYSIKDKGTGFMCAAKKVPLVSFSSEEVGSWSALQSPQVVELFGVVREGPSIILFMDLKSSSLGQLVEERGRLPEDLSLHYLQQVLGALNHLHRKRVLHLDIKADNILLSEDGKDAFLCDFGYSERLDKQGLSYCKSLKGTETHMAPEVLLNEPRSSKADIWSSCCMLLHMLNGCHPWTRYYSRPLFLKIAEEPPPLREIPCDCSSYTADVIKAGLQKDPIKRASAKELFVKTAKALKGVGGLRSRARGGPYQKPLGKPENPDPAYSATPTTSHQTMSSDNSELQWMSSEHKRNVGDGECNEKPEKVKQWKQTEETRNDDHCPPKSLLHIQNTSPEPRIINKTEPEPEQELRRLEKDFYLSSLSLPHSAELQEQLLSCICSDCPSTRENFDKKDSGRWSVGPGDDLSSGVFSYNSQQDGQSFSRDWLAPTHQPLPRCFDGVDVYIRDFDGKCFHIRETPGVKVCHVARGISDQISENVFSLQTEDGCLVPHDKEVLENSLFLRCVPAPDSSHYHQYGHNPCCTLGPNCKLPWSWRIREGVLETKD
ncbi:mitogen-activated protein kinase kinase kinase 14-like [Sinocyclocheilus anshuiensis]|uniref:Mitogen-activated protein kinase kinase kinase 14 n=1 Tax=Sinocyclocheilus anshuiensis TaxID=1608454 RepID=A0A671SFK7_9TELE|nr:PREDICTED: mitogen-activated protein kinase kinase kinase 14-like [Sinocyclocheilus anshuiensis]XP_016324100.1 PREDICTED: mitogen-activated protein kinase kinase kinase 14-like [Sinocyclocheilus anshuiensis]XP_016324101.1 PREDICTED: mitogen-activated protein kinase kinase kinase 14-like [Sinocyclocheilus anshuiensis]XP_016324102.1 PREDICTED: mitogen-activated protein kinase kinase kinase 14-like [Sinocyclocheilus anshuiensis]